LNKNLYLISLLSITCLSITLYAIEFPIPQIDFEPEKYICHYIETPLIIDGKINEPDWDLALWTDPFVDIEGKIIPTPNYLTRVKMLWDDNYFYVAADLEEPHIWGTLTTRDAVIFQDNDFEVFIDPDGDSHEYFELEINALGTVWDLFLIKPYRDKQQVALDAWDIKGLNSAVDQNGTINDPSDYDKSWTVEIAFPWKILKQGANKQVPPLEGDYWRINFSRVQWHHKIVENRYLKIRKPEENWVWSPQGLINMHYPEMWGFVIFSTDPPGYEDVNFEIPLEEKGKWYLRQLYYAEKRHFEKYNKYTDKIETFDLSDPNEGVFVWPPEIKQTYSFWEAILNIRDSNKKIHIREDGKVWVTENKDITE